MTELQKITPEQWKQMILRGLNNGNCTICDETGLLSTWVQIFRNEKHRLMVCISTDLELTTHDETIHEELIYMDEYPELYELYDFHQERINPQEVENLVLGAFLAGSADDWNHLPTTTETTH